MPKRRTEETQEPAFNATEEEAQARRIESLAAKKKKALEALAEAQRMEADLGIGQSPYEGEGNGHGEEDPLTPGLSPRLEGILSELGGEGSYTVYRINQGQAENCGQYGLDSYPAQFLEIVRAEGGGTFKVMFRKPDGLIAGQHTQTFSKTVFARREAEAKQGGVTDFLTLMEKRDEAHRRELGELRLEQTRLMTQMFQAMSQKTPMSELAAMMKILKDSDAPKKSALSEVRETVELLNALKDEVEPSSPMESAISKALKMLSPILEGAVGKVLARSQEDQGAGTVQVPAAPAKALPAPASSPVAPAQAGAAPSLSPEEMKLAHYAPMLLATILKGAEPEPTAVFIVDTAKSPEAWDELCAFVDLENLEERLIAKAPDLAQYREWLAKFVTQLRGEVDQLSSVLDPESPGPGTANAGASAPAAAVEGSMGA